VSLVFDWANLGDVALPCLVSITGAAFLATFLRRAAEQSRLPRSRERCIRCRFESQLEEFGDCQEACAVNVLPTLPLVLFVAVSALAALTFFFPATVRTYILPFDYPDPAYAAILLDVVLVATLSAALVLAAYFVQDLPYHRDLFTLGAAAAALAGLFVGTTGSGVAPTDAAILVPIALTAVLLGLAAEARARRGRPAFGLRSLGAATAPLFLVTVLAFGRIAEVLALAAQAR
jgi:hypothetical protein